MARYASNIKTVILDQKFVTADGVEHKTKADALAHSDPDFLKQFANWRLERFEAAMAGDTEKGKKDGLALETLAKRLYAKRVERGDVRKRAPNKAKEAPAATGVTNGQHPLHQPS